MVEIRVTAGSVPQLTEKLPGMTAPARLTLFRAIGQALKQEARAGANGRHMTAKSPSRKGGGFWAKIRDSVNYEATADGVTVGSAHYAATHKQFGGTISAPGKGAGSTGAKMLTIPISDKSRGYTVGQLTNRYLIFRLPETNILAGIKKTKKELTGTGKGATNEMVMLFVLKKRVTQKAEPWFPDEAKAARAISQLLDDLK